jgi:hypothetical protein
MKVFGPGQRAMEGRQRFLLVIRWNHDREDVHKGLITGLTPARYYSIGAKKVSPAPGRYGNGLTRYSATVETTLPSKKGDERANDDLHGAKTSPSVFYGRIGAAPGGPVPDAAARTQV